MLSALELADMRATLAESLPDTGVIQHRVSSPAGGGGVTHTYTDGPSLSLRLSPIGGGESSSGDRGDDAAGSRVSDETTHVVTFEHATAIEHQDRIVIDGQTYEATYVRERGSWELCVRVEVKEIP